MREGNAAAICRRWAGLLRGERLSAVAVPGARGRPGLGRPAYLLDARVAETPDHTKDFGLEWTALYDAYRFDRPRHYEQFLRLGVTPEAVRGAAVLDAGMGLGRLSEIALGEARVVVGCDLSESVATAATFIHADHFVPIRASIADLPLADAAFDFVFSWGVVHHCPEPEAVLDELWRVVKPGGTLAVWVYGEGPGNRLRSYFNWHLKDLSAHEMLGIADALTNVAHMLQLTAPTVLNAFLREQCFAVKNTKEYTRLNLYDGLGPDYHHLIGKDRFAAWGGTKGIRPEFRDDPPLTAIFRKPG
jgi:SAM-dependent methyltransferase